MRGFSTIQTGMKARSRSSASPAARAWRDGGIRSVAVYAEPDLHALHVRVAHEAIALGAMTPRQSYPDTGKNLAAATQTHADTVHPGYRFPAENAEFADTVIDAGLT